MHKWSILLLAVSWTTPVWSQQNPNGQLPLASFPEPYLLLVRDAEVQRDLKFSEDQQAVVQRGGAAWAAPALEALAAGGESEELAFGVEEAVLAGE